jgi:DNA replication protein DnaC
MRELLRQPVEHELDVKLRDYDIKKQLADLEAAVDARDAAIAKKDGVSVEEMRSKREAAIKRDVDREIRERRAELLGKDKRLITPEDFDLIVENEPSGLLQTKALKVVVRFRKSKKNFCILSGPKGIGKTFAVCFAKSREGGLIVSADDMTTAWRNEHDAALKLRERIREVPFLAVDELGFEKDVEAGIHALQNTVNERQGVGMGTVVTTNLSEKDLRARYDARTTERITHGGAFVELTGPSLRRK